MKSFFVLLFALLLLISVIGTGVALYYLSTTTEFSRKPASSGTAR